MHLNQRQTNAISQLLDPRNTEGEPFIFPIELVVEDGQLQINSLWLHTDGTWATYRQEFGDGRPEPMSDFVGPPFDI